MDPARQAWIVVDLGFGDAGKGLITDYLVRRHAAGAVVRFNGGAQAGHNVLTPEGRQHTFCQFGAGSFVAGVRTLLAPQVVVHPTALLIEAKALRAKGIQHPLSRISVHRECRLITPYHQALNRLRELARAGTRHGSCGVGFGEAVADSLQNQSLRAHHLRERTSALELLGELRARVNTTVDQMRPELHGNVQAEAELAILQDASLAERWLDACEPVEGIEQLDDDQFAHSLNSLERVVFEGAQGMLLDQTYGFHPHTTWSDCRFTAARHTLERSGWSGQIRHVGVIRTFLTRHGAGPLPTETQELKHVDPHNAAGPWQGPLRAGWPDLVLLAYAADICGGIDELAVTHTDVTATLPRLKLATDYASTERGRSALQQLRAARQFSADPRAVAMNAAPLRDLEPSYDTLEAPQLTERLLQRLSSAAGAPVRYVSHGPCSTDVQTH